MKGLYRDNRGMLLPRHFDNSLSVYLFLKFEPQLGKSEKFNNQEIKENKSFRILFIIKKQLKSRQALHQIFLQPQYKVYRGASILYFNALFSDIPSFSKISQLLPHQNQQTKSFPFNIYFQILKLSYSFVTIHGRYIVYIKHLTLINSNFVKQKKLAFSFE